MGTSDVFTNVTSSYGAEATGCMVRTSIGLVGGGWWVEYGISILCLYTLILIRTFRR
jgi:hypothetical protein